MMKTARFSLREDEKLYEAVTYLKTTCGNRTAVDWKKVLDFSDVNIYWVTNKQTNVEFKLMYEIWV